MKWNIILLFIILLNMVLMQAQETNEEIKPDDSFIGWLFNSIKNIWEYWVNGIIVKISEKEPIQEEAFTPKEILAKELYPEKYQTIYSNGVVFELPVEATHYWTDSKGENDLYEVIIERLEIENKNYSLRIKWNAPRWQEDLIRINYTFKDGVLLKESIKPYSITGNKKTVFNNFDVEISEIDGYEKILIENESCTRDIDKNTLWKTEEQIYKEKEKCQIIEVKPKYKFKEYQPITISAKSEITAIDDIAVTSCGVLSNPNEKYYLISNITTTSTNCLTIGANNITIDGRGYAIIKTTQTGSGITSDLYSNLNITNITLYGFGNGISIKRATNTSISKTNFINNYNGISLLYSGTTGNNNTLIENITFNNLSYNAISPGFYNNYLIIKNINATAISYDLFLGGWQSNNTLIENINLRGGRMSLESTKNFSIKNIKIDNSGYANKDSCVHLKSGREFYGKNWTLLDCTTYVNPSDYMGAISLWMPNESYVEDVIIKGGTKHGISWKFNSYTLNASFRNINITSALNQESIAIYLTDNNGNCTLYLINATYDKGEKIYKTTGLDGTIYRKWVATVKINDTLGNNYSGVNTWGNINILNDNEMLIDYSFDDVSKWNYGGDAQIEYGYFYVYDLASGGEAPHKGGWISPKNFTPQAGEKYTIKIEQVDTSYGNSPLNISICGNSYGFEKGLTITDMRTITCTNSNPLNISVPADNIGKDGYYYTGISDYISIKKWVEITDDNKITNADGIAELFLTQYINNLGIITNRTVNNYTIYAYNTSYNSSQNMTTNRYVSFTLPPDSTPPFIEFISPTTPQGDTYNSTLIFNISAWDNLNIKNITVNLINSSGILETKTSEISPFYGNFSNLKKGNYIINATVFDITNNQNSTWRTYNVLDNTPPFIKIIYPIYSNYTFNISSLNYSVSDLNLDSCWYSLNNGTTNISMTCGINLTLLASNEGWNTWTVYANDTSGNINQSSVTFYKETMENITLCRTLNYPLTYQIKNNLTQTIPYSRCLLINSSNVIIEGNGFNVWSNYGNSIEVNSKSNITINNTKFINSYRGFYCSYSDNIYLNYLNSKHYDIGIGLFNCSKSTIKNSILNGLMLENIGILLDNSHNSYIQNTTIINNGEGLYLYASSNNFIEDSVFENIISDIHIIAFIYSSNNNTFLNTFYNMDKEIIESDSTLIRLWNYTAKTTDNFSNLIHNANIEIRNDTGLLHTLFTNYSGVSNSVILLDYNNTNGIRYFSNIYNITAYSNMPTGIYLPKSELWNITQKQNSLHTIVFGINETQKTQAKDFAYNKETLPLIRDKNKYSYNKLDEN